MGNMPSSLYKKGGAVKKKSAAKKKFKAHPMYSKSGKMVMAKKMADHLRLKKLGYTHTKPKAKKKK